MVATKDQRVEKVITIMRERLDRQMSVSDLAREVNLSTWRLCHIFKNETGMGPMQYLRSLRMEQAKSLLESTFLSVKQIRFVIGAGDESHFVRDFKATYGVSPTKFRLHRVGVREGNSVSVSQNIKSGG